MPRYRYMIRRGDSPEIRGTILADSLQEAVEVMGYKYPEEREFSVWGPVRRRSEPWDPWVHVGEDP